MHFTTKPIEVRHPVQRATTTLAFLLVTILAIAMPIAQAQEAPPASPNKTPAATNSAPANSAPAAEQTTVQAEVVEPKPTLESKQFTLNMREADIRGFIQWVADRTGRNIILHNNVRGVVTVISQRALSSSETYDLFLTVLQLSGFTAVDDGMTLRVIPDTDAKTVPLPFATDKSRGPSLVLAIVEIENGDASAMVGILRPLAAPSAFIEVFADTNSLIVVDSADNLNKLTSLVRLLDVPGQTDIERIKIVHASASEISNLVTGIVKGESKSSSIEIVVDERSNALFMTGSLGQRKRVRKLISQLDIPLEGEGNTQVIYLSYIDAEEITPILQSVGDSIIKEQKTENKTFSIESSETTNALVISAPPGLLNSLRDIVSKLDIRRAQVLVEAIVVQVSGGDNKDLGIAWVTGEARRSTPHGSVAGVNALNNAEASIFSGVSGDTENADAATLLVAGSGLTYGYFKDGDLLAALRAVASKRKSNIMSTPTIVALDNEEANLLVGQSVPFVTGSQTSASSDVSNPFQTIQRQDIGVTLDITPRINQGDSITLEIAQTTENVIENNVDAQDLITEKTEIKTSALIRDGEVLVIGGLISNSQVKNRTQVPILGALPFVGKLFRSDSTRTEKSNLMVFIRPTILKDELQVEGITASRYAFMREQQLQAALRSYAGGNEPALLEEFEVFSPRPRTSDTEGEQLTPVDTAPESSADA